MGKYHTHCEQIFKLKGQIVANSDRLVEASKASDLLYPLQFCTIPPCFW